MADERQQPDRERPAQDALPTPSEAQTPGTPVPRERAQGDIFDTLAGYSFELDGIDVPPVAPPADRREVPSLWTGSNPPQAGARLPWGLGCPSRTQKILVAGIIAVTIALLYVLVIRTPPVFSTYPIASAEPPSPEKTPVRTGEAAAGRAPSSAPERPTPGRDGVEPPAPGTGGFQTRPSVAASAEFPGARSGDAGREEPSADRSPLLAVERRTGTRGPLSEPMPGSTRTLAGPESLSLQLADKLYLRRDFEPALAMYDKLYRRLPATEENQPLRDFLLLRMALCSKNSGNAAQADSLLRAISLSRLPILRALARYHQSTALLDRKRYLEAAARAYQTAALVSVASYDPKWVSAVQQQCGFLAAEAVTHNVLSLADADSNLPAALWSKHPDLDPFVEMGEPQLRVFLASGADQLEGTVLSPQIRPVGDDGRTTDDGRQTTDDRSHPSSVLRPPSSGLRWSILCNGAPIEELLARFAAKAGVNVRWSDSGPAASAEEGPETRTDAFGNPDNIRARPVYLYLTAATTAQVVALAAGSVGLIAQTDDKGNLRLFDPTSYSSLADHTSLLAEEAITLWQRFLLTAPDDPRVVNAHFATALLQATRGRFSEAIAEYKVVANRYAKHALAPHALLQSGVLKVRLRDYVGAHTDLKQLVELYPETELSDRACLHLADATLKAGLYEEATGLYRKVYNLGLSLESQAASALGAGRCLYETRQYEEAAKWLTRYIELTTDDGRRTTADRSHPSSVLRPPSSVFSAACLLLGKTCLALHKPQQAQAALNLAIKGELSRQQHVETIAELVKTYLEQGLFLEALGTLEGTGGWQLSQQETIELVLLRAQTLRSIGLVDKAIPLLEEKGQYLPGAELQGRLALELAKCYRDSGDLENARKTLGQAFPTVEPGPLAGQIGRELADVCLRLGQTAQAVSICSRLLEHAPASERPPTLELLASVYRKQGRYDQAVAALLDRYSDF